MNGYKRFIGITLAALITVSGLFMSIDNNEKNDVIGLAFVMGGSNFVGITVETNHRKQP